MIESGAASVLTGSREGGWLLLTLDLETDAGEIRLGLILGFRIDKHHRNNLLS
jgi:hypothetical protein